MLATAGFVLGHLAALIVIVAACAAAGWLALGKIEFRDALEAAAFRVGTGSGILGTVLFLIGLAGMLTRPVVGSLVGLLLVVAAIFAFRRRPGQRVKPGLVSWLAALCFVPSFLLAIYPPTAFDATMYQLPYARLFAENNAVVFAHTLRFPVFPQLQNMLFAAALLLYDDVTAHLTQLVAFAVTAAAVVSSASRYGGRAAGVIAFALWVGSPLAVYLSGAGYIDLGVAMFVALAMIAFERWRENRVTSWLLLSGALAGMAAATKYHGVLVVALMTAAVFVTARGIRTRSTISFLLAALLLASPFYLRNEIVTGNPFFPYLDRIFGGIDWPAIGDHRVVPEGLTAREQVVRVARWTFASPHFLTFPWRVAYDAKALRGLPTISLWMPLIFLGGLAGAVRSSALAPGFLVALIYTAAAVRLEPRYLIIIFPLFIIPAAVIAGRVFTTKWLAWATAVLLLIPGTGYGMFRVLQQGAVPVTAEERRAYLSTQVAVYPAIDVLNRRCGSEYTVYVLHQEYAHYHADGTFLGDHLGPARYRLIEPELGEPQRLQKVLRGLGVDYFVVASHLADGLQARPDFTFERVARAGGFDVFLVPGGKRCAAEKKGGSG